MAIRSKSNLQILNTISSCVHNEQPTNRTNRRLFERTTLELFRLVKRRKVLKNSKEKNTRAKLPTVA